MIEESGVSKSSRHGEAPWRLVTFYYSCSFQCIAHHVCYHKFTMFVREVSGLVYEGTQYNTSDQFIFLCHLNELQCTYSSVPLASVFRSCRRVHLAVFSTEDSPPQMMQLCHCHLKIAWHASVLSAVGTNRSQRLPLANVVDGVRICSHIHSATADIAIPGALSCSRRTLDRNFPRGLLFSASCTLNKDVIYRVGQKK